MATEFHAEPGGDEQACARSAALSPTNPFCTAAYVRAQSRLGYDLWLFSAQGDGQPIAACAGFVKSGYLNRSIEIVSVPDVPEPDVFWRGFRSFCAQERISHVVLGSFGSSVAAIPMWPGEVRRTPRTEHVLDLSVPDLDWHVSSSHIRNIRRGRKADLQVRRVTDRSGCPTHARLQQQSMSRRRGRGDTIEAASAVQEYVALVETGAGELFQAVQGTRVLSSVLVLLADRGAYYQSAGTTGDGMACGASHFLVMEIARRLQDRACAVFNLGGAHSDNPGLQRFKSGFGTTEVKLESAEFFFGGATRRTVTTAARLLRVLPSRVLRELVAGFE